MVLYHQAGETLYFVSHSVMLDASVLDQPTYELYSAHDATKRYTVKYQPFAPNPEVHHHKYYREYITLSTLPRSPRVIPLVDTLEVTERDQAGYQLYDCEIAGSLRGLAAANRLNDQQIVVVLKGVCEGLAFLHAAGYLHRNISLDSVFLNQDSEWILGDFYATTKMNIEQVESERMRDTELMTLETLRAPEQMHISTIKLVGSAADMWAVGCLLYELLSGQSPFSLAKGADQLKVIFPPLGDKVNRRLAELVDRLLVLDPNLRPTAQEVLLSLQAPDPRADTPSAIGKGSVFSSLLKTSTKSWVDNATSLNDTMPESKYVEKLIGKAWQKQGKIGKFYHFLTLRPLNLTIIAIKALVLFHKYLMHGPKEVLAVRSTSNHEKFLSQIDEIWTNPANISVPDNHKCEYFNGLIRQYCKLMKTKVTIMQKFPITGQWEGELTISAREIEQFLGHWGRLNHFVKGLFLGVPDLPELRCGLAGLQLDDIFKMMKMIKIVVEKLLAKGNLPKPELLMRSFNEEIVKSQSHATSLMSAKPNSHVGFFESFMLQPPKPIKIPELPSPEVLPVIEIPAGDFSLPSKPYHSNKKASPEVSSFSSAGSSSSTPDPNHPKADIPRSPPEPKQESSSLRAEVPRAEAARVQEPKASHSGLDPSQFGLGEASWVIKESQLVQSEVIGGGSSCTVYKGTYKRTPVAIKVLRSVVNGEHLKEFSRELTALLHLRHPNLVLFMGAVFNPQLAIVTEFCSGDTLFRLLHQDKQVQLSWKQKLKMCRDVAHGMTYLHESEPPILHRDLKSLNLLLTDKVSSATDGITVKITDFGVSKFLDESVNMMNTGQMGTCHWMAPEVLAGYHYSLPADVYSYGIVIWEIVCRETPYRGLNPTLIPYRVLNCNERPSMELLPASCPEALRTLMVGCWQTDPALRPTFPQILDALEGISMTNQMDNLLI